MVAGFVRVAGGVPSRVAGLGQGPGFPRQVGRSRFVGIGLCRDSRSRAGPGRIARLPFLSSFRPQARSVWGWNMVVVVARIGVGWDSFGAGLVVD